MELSPGDHVCSLYKTNEELATTAASSLADGLGRGKGAGMPVSDGEISHVRSALHGRGVNVEGESRRSALHLFGSRDTYIVRGAFDPEQTMRVISDAIEHALTDGFKGFRAAADMSWALMIDKRR